MPVETANYVTELNPNLPGVTDPTSQGDDHIRLMKTALKNTLPNFTAAALQSSQAELDVVAHTKQFAAQNGSVTAPSVTFSNDATAGLYKGARTGQVAIAHGAGGGQGLRGPGAVPVGAIMDFPKSPGTIGTEWLECDGNLYNVADYPDLGAFLGSTFGGDGVTTFKTPNLMDTGRYRRTRNGTLAAGSIQTNAFKTHTHTGVTNASGDHVHGASVSDPGHTHTINASGTSSGGSTSVTQGTGAYAATGGIAGTAVTGISVSIGAGGNHSHSVAINSNSDGGDTETRPETFVVYTCIKT